MSTFKFNHSAIKTGYLDKVKSLPSDVGGPARARDNLINHDVGRRILRSNKSLYYQLATSLGIILLFGAIGIQGYVAYKMSDDDDNQYYLSIISIVVILGVITVMIFYHLGPALKRMKYTDILATDIARQEEAPHTRLSLHNTLTNIVAEATGVKDTQLQAKADIFDSISKRVLYKPNEENLPGQSRGNTRNDEYDNPELLPAPRSDLLTSGGKERKLSKARKTKSPKATTKGKKSKATTKARTTKARS